MLFPFPVSPSSCFIPSLLITIFSHNFYFPSTQSIFLLPTSRCITSFFFADSSSHRWCLSSGISRHIVW
jgi:hypothetical protein